MNPGWYLRVFDPVFSYERAAQKAGDYPALCAYLRLAGEMLGRDYVGDLPLERSYYRYRPTMVILFNCLGEFYCQTVVNGQYDKQYDVLKDTEELRAFFEEHAGNLTVLDNDRAREFVPEFEAVYTYVKAMTECRQMNSEYIVLLREQRDRVERFREECDMALFRDVENEYSDALGLLEDTVDVVDGIMDAMKNKKRYLAERNCWKEEKGVSRMFGLFLYALEIGLGRSRHLKEHREILSRAFSNMLSDMHVFLKEHPLVQSVYADEWHLPANERAKVQYLLEAEGLYGEEWGYVGNDLF